jgi:hypothetical protein
MKTKPIATKLTSAFWLMTCSAWLMMPAASRGQVVIGSWQNTTGDGWIDWGTGDSIVNPAVTNIYSFVQGVVPGYAQSLQVNKAGWNQTISIKLEYQSGAVAAFTNNNLLNFTFSVPAWTNGGYSQLNALYVNASGLGWYGVPFSTNTWSATGNTGNNSSGGMPNFYFSNGSPFQSQTVIFNYSSLLPSIVTNPNPYIELIFAFNNGGGAPSYWWLNNVTLSGSPTQIIYTVDDFSTNGVGPANPTNYDYSATQEIYSQGDISSVWSEWFGNGITSVSFDPNMNVSGNTNTHGAMALAMTWNAATDGYQQFVLWQGNGTYTYVPGGTVGIGYPQYTNLECDVMFDPSSAGTTNANGVLGVIRLGVRGFGAFGQDWINGSYTTISDTNWHHINAPLNSSNPDYANVGAAIIGEDVTGYVGGGGLTGSQILYVDNIRFTGPLVKPKVPPPILGAPQQAKPGLRIFAGSAVNTYDRELLYTVDQNQSWVDSGAHFPVTYSFSLQDYNPNILQTMVELIGGGTTPTTYGEYADYSGPTMLWLQLNPAVGGQVMASVQWKTNLPGANPNVTATQFTNSTAVGTWSLVFTGPNTGYVSGPGQVILGSTNFTIADGTVTTDFADPVFAAFGLQANQTAGEGAYEDWGMISVTGVLDGNELEDFTKEGSDISANLTPSGFFNNSMSALPASLIIQTTNDAWWVNWSQPANNFTLASSTNLVNPHWINPGYYGGYSDTNAPRVMPLTTPFASKFWVLLPKDDLPTVDGKPGSAPSPQAFFLTATNVVSP